MGSPLDHYKTAQDMALEGCFLWGPSMCCGYIYMCVCVYLRGTVPADLVCVVIAFYVAAVFMDQRIGYDQAIYFRIKDRNQTLIFLSVPCPT